MTADLVMRLTVSALLLALSACSQYPVGYCGSLVKAYEECRADAECWGNRAQWGTVSYMSELNECYGRVARGKP